MLIPNADQATIAAATLRDYLRSATHPIGRFKARFFAALGFSSSRWAEFAEALRIQHLTQAAEAGTPTVRGQKFTIRAILVGPNGQSAVVVSVVNMQPLDVVVLIVDVPADGLKRGDLGAVVQVYAPDALEVEFVTASGRTKALVTLRASDVREAADDDLMAVHPTSRDA